MSLTAHWLNCDFKQNHAVLHVQEFNGSHTGEAIILIMFEKSGISHQQIHVVLRDNDASSTPLWLFFPQSTIGSS